MELPVTPKPMLASSPDLPTDHTDKLFGIVYIILTGVIDTIIPAASPWSWAVNSSLVVGFTRKKTQPKSPQKTMGQLPKTGSLTHEYTVLAVPETIFVSYKLRSGKTTTTKIFPGASDAQEMVACPYLAQAS
ncbi:hypothetical protein DSO57_1031716 [Entomophthora muscae]|uniref:Uncharacterized protein n=1 Tax=Entomophthora muscae TaxID=34485 RepID=A0ACC2RRI8_9FUNG|nr:hypothetical protein DSO57_1031716 [Entomophthora muscae]